MQNHSKDYGQARPSGEILNYLLSPYSDILSMIIAVNTQRLMQLATWGDDGPYFRLWLNPQKKNGKCSLESWDWALCGGGAAVVDCEG